MQETWVQPLVLEDHTRRGATKPMLHNYWACGQQLLRSTLEPVVRDERSQHNEKPTLCKYRLAPAHRSERKARAAVKTQHSQ